MLYTPIQNVIVQTVLTDLRLGDHQIQQMVGSTKLRVPTLDQTQYKTERISEIYLQDIYCDKRSVLNGLNKGNKMTARR